MVGQITYTEEQILFILRLSLENEKRDEILRQYHQRFNKPLTASQLRYVKGKYGHDPEFGTALINGALPTNGGARKTAPPSPPPKQKTRIVIKRPNNSVNQGSSNTHSPCPTLPGPIQYHGPQHFTTGHAPLHCQDSAFTGNPQQTIRTQSSLRYEAYPQPTGVTNNAISSHQPPPQPDPAWAPIWDPDHPYGYQPVLEHYKAQYDLNGLSKPATKRKREDSDDVREQTNGASLQKEIAVDAKRVKMESPVMNLQYAYPDYDPAVAHNSSWYQTQVSETTQMNENVAQAVSPLTGLLNQIDTEFLAQGNSSLAMSTAPSFSTLPMYHPYTGAVTAAPISASYLQTPQMGYFDPYPDATWYPGMDTIGTLLASSPNSLPSLSNQKIGASRNETTSSWTTPYLDNMNEDGWHNTSSPLENSLLNTPMFDPALNQDLTPYMDPALLDDESGVETGQTQYSDHAVKQEEDTMRSDEDGTFDWEDMFDLRSSTNDESGQSQD